MSEPLTLANGKKGGRPRKNNPEKTHSVSDGLPDESKKNPNQEPLTSNHKPDSNNNSAERVFTVIESVKNRALISSHPSHQWRIGLAMPKSGDALTMMVNVQNRPQSAKTKSDCWYYCWYCQK